ncbi:MAG: hypothetical protein C5B54_10255 [Acidobacteria bacterium]|nr:MAG: hypothetical protein C5B54_10255 [Acidobacteriota bacterium]
MKLSETEKKILMLAMDQVASDGEIAAASSRFIHSLRKRYKNGTDLIKDIEQQLFAEPQRPMPQGFPAGFGGFGPSMTRPFGQAPPNTRQPRPNYQPPPDPANWANVGGPEWQDILRQAQRQATDFQQRMYQQHAEAFKQAEAYRQQRAKVDAHAQTPEHQEWEQQQTKKKPSVWDKLKEML